MFAALSEFVLGPASGSRDPQHRLKEVELIGAKACGLALLPKPWTPPFLVLSANLYRRWVSLGVGSRAQILNDEIRSLERHMTGWNDHWPSGLILRSSAVSETLRDRGAHKSVNLTADYGMERLCAAITHIFSSFATLKTDDAIAVIVQARVQSRCRGHLSNERRVSKTINQWMWELEGLIEGEGRFNSQRATPPPIDNALILRASSQRAALELCKRVGRWCTGLRVGPVHLEIGISSDALWIFQLDVEDDQPDDGVNPNSLLRRSDPRPSDDPPVGSPFHVATFKVDTGWPKIDKVREFLVGRSLPFPSLYYATGAEIEAVLAQGRDLAADIQTITHDNAVCRTDCVARSVDPLNLPRTDTVSATDAVAFMAATVEMMKENGVTPQELCFVIHKFVPATAAAWALADPLRQIVLIDALWGLPDGLQFLSHDTFEYDTRRSSISSETTRYKPLFLRETNTGEWNLAHVARKHARRRCISVGDIREVANATHAIAVRLNRRIQIMWFCGVDDKAHIGRNIPWFMMQPEPQTRPSTRIAPGLLRVTIRTMEDLAGISEHNCVLELDPEAQLFRNEEFLNEVARLALAYGHSVILRGSTLGHAFYTLERKGVSVVATESSRTRSRQRQVFRKLVRDDIPKRISEHGEKVSVAKIGKSESRAALVIKLYEESQELLAAQDPESVTAELADLLEIVRSLCLATGVDFQQVEGAATEKRNIRGSFEQNVVLLETSWPAWEEKYRKSPKETIELRELGQIIHRGKEHLMNFAAVVGGNSATLQLHDGTNISVRVSGNGIEIREIDGPEKSDAQIAFDFEK